MEGIGIFTLKWKWKKKIGFTGFITKTVKSSLDGVPRDHSVLRHLPANKEAEPKRWLSLIVFPVRKHEGPSLDPQNAHNS